MKSISFLNLIDLNTIDEIYAEELIISKIFFNKIKYIKKLDRFKFNINKSKKILFIINYKNFKENFISDKNFGINQYLIFNLPFFITNKSIKKYKFKIYYILPNILNPEIFIMKKDSKYLTRYWSLKNNSLFRSILNYLSFFTLKYKLGLFLLPKVMVINEK